MAKLFSISRKLRRYVSESGRQVFIRVRFRNSSEIEIPIYDYVNHIRTPISVRDEHWLKGYVTGGKYHIPIRDLNNLLSNVEANVKDAVNELLEKNIEITRKNIIQLTYIREDNFFENERKTYSGEIIVDDDGGAFASPDEFSEYIAESEDPKFDTLKKTMGLYEKKYILDYWDDFIKEYAPNSYKSTRSSIETFIKETGDNCKIKDFSSDWLQRFFSYTIDNGYSLKKDGTDKKPYTITTVTKFNKHLISFGDYLFGEVELIDNQEYRRFKLYAKSKKKSLLKYSSNTYNNTHALSKIEFDWFYDFNYIDKQLAIVRDMFVLQVWLGGLRVGDFYNLSKRNFVKDLHGKSTVWFEQNKTNDEVFNLFNQNYLNRIFEHNPNIFQEFPRVDIYNRKLREAAKIAGLDRMLRFRYEYANQSRATYAYYPIHEKISNEWARNCAVSILAGEKYSDDHIAKFTGHRDLSVIRYYKDIHEKEMQAMMEGVRPELIDKL